MGHPNINNTTPYTFQELYLNDEEGISLLVIMINATYSIEAGNSKLFFLEKQPLLDIEGKHWGDPETTSYKYEPVIAFCKPATDIVLIGHAFAQAKVVSEISIGLRVGLIQKVVKVIGDRYLFRRSGEVSITPPQPFEKIPLIYERAFGGWDRRDPTPDKYRFEQRNPVGTGYLDPFVGGDAQVKLPNLEDPQRPYRGYGDNPPPAGFGFISPNWQPRASFAGTYDEAWDKGRKPLLPKDFDRRFFNAASPGLIAPGYLKGDESVTIINASPDRKVSFNLPGVPAPKCKVVLRGGKLITLQTQLDTVIINMDERLLFLIWRAHTPVRNGPHDVVSIETGSDGGPSVQGVV